MVDYMHEYMVQFIIKFEWIIWTVDEDISSERVDSTESVTMDNRKEDGQCYCQEYGIMKYYYSHE